MSRAPAPARALRRAARLCGPAALALLAAGCGTRAAGPPRATLVNASGAELCDVAFVGERGLLAPVVDRLAPADSASDTLGIRGEDAVFVSFVAEGRACVSVDSARVGGRAGHEVRFVVDSTLTARVAGVRPGR